MVQIARDSSDRPPPNSTYLGLSRPISTKTQIPIWWLTTVIYSYLQLTTPDTSRPSTIHPLLPVTFRNPLPAGGRGSILGLSHRRLPLSNSQTLKLFNFRRGAGGILGLSHRCLPLSNSQTLKLFTF